MRVFDRSLDKWRMSEAGVVLNARIKMRKLQTLQKLARIDYLKQREWAGGLMTCKVVNGERKEEKEGRVWKK